jgi:predicted GH43/DUF377 family glycosyl hydrolase
MQNRYKFFTKITQIAMGFKPIAMISIALITASVANAQQKSQLPKWAFGPFVRPANVNPIIAPDTASVFFDPMNQKMWHWESNDTFNPAATIKDGKIYVIYRSEDNSGKGISQRTSRLGIAETADGTTIKRFSKPVLFPADDNVKEYEWRGGCEDPRVAVTADGTYLILYTEWNGKVPRLAAATSRDLFKWKKYGPVFKQAYNGRFFDIQSKSASIVTKLVNGKQVIAKVQGKYWLYWGEKNVYAATSTDLVNWEPLVNTDGTLKVLFAPRKGYFDSIYTECGPPSIITDKGIVLLYNGKNSDTYGDKNYASDTYCGGQALFSLSDPAKLITRLDKPYFVPQESFEKSGQYPAGTVFTEGLVYFKAKWFLYYGCADSRVAVAVYNPAKQ